MDWEEQPHQARTAQRINAGSVCRHLKITDGWAWKVSPAYQPLSPGTCNTSIEAPNNGDTAVREPLLRPDARAIRHESNRECCLKIAQMTCCYNLAMKPGSILTVLLAVIAGLLVLDIWKPTPVQAGGARVVVTKVKPSDTPVKLSGYQVVGFSCVSSDECMIAVR